MPGAGPNKGGLGVARASAGAPPSARAVPADAAPSKDLLESAIVMAFPLSGGYAAGSTPPPYCSPECRLAAEALTG